MSSLQLGLDAMKTKVLIITAPSSEPRDNIVRAGRNVEKVYINSADKIRVFDVLKAHKIVVEEGALGHINSFLGHKQEQAPAAAAN